MTYLIFAPEGAKAEILPEVGAEPASSESETADSTSKVAGKKST